MKNPLFTYSAPRSTEEVLDLLAVHGDEAKILAGGQSLLPLLAMRLARPGVLIDINSVTELSGIKEDADAVRVGAITRERTAERDATVARHLPVMAASLPHVGHIPIRNRGTIGGSLAHADASAELPLVAVMTDARMTIRSRKGDRTVTAEHFFLGHFTSAVREDELLVEVEMPKGSNGQGWGFEEIARRHGDFALVAAAAMVRIDEAGRIDQARMGLVGVADRPLRFPAVEQSLIGTKAAADTFATAAHEATREIDPPADIHGSSLFRRHLAQVALTRAMTAAVTQPGAEL